MLAHTHTVCRSPSEETQKCGITPGRHNASGRCDHGGDGEKDKEKKRERDRYGPRSESDESARSLPGGWRLRGESCSRRRTFLLVDVGTLIPYSSLHSVCGCHGSFRHSCPSRWLHFWQSFSWIHGQTRLKFGGGGLELSCTGTIE